MNEEKLYRTVKELANDPQLCFTEPMIRYYILHAGTNGLAPAIRKIGRKIVLRRDLVISWLEKQVRR